VVSASKEKLEQKSTHLKHKKAELNDIMAETQKEETFLTEKSAEYEATNRRAFISCLQKNPF
jgi:peptidoglycan hydrolase CwlO-like protein